MGIAKNTIFYTIGAFVPRVSSLIVLPLYTKFLSTAEFGILSSIEALKSILIVFLTVGLERSMYRLFYDYDKDDRKDFMGTLLISVSLLAAFIAGLALSICAPTVHALFPSIPFIPYFAIGIATCLAMAIGIVPAGYIQLSERPTLFMHLALGKTCAIVISSCIVIMKFKLGVVGLLSSQLIVEAFFSVLSIIILRQDFRYRFRPSMLKAALAFSLPMFPSLVSAWLMNMSNRVFIDRYFTQTDIGKYSFGSKITEASTILGVAYMLAYQPIYYRSIAEMGEEGAKSELRKYNTFFAIIVMLSVFFVSFFAREATILLADRRYLDAVPLIPFLALTAWINQITGLNNLALYQRKKTWHVMSAIMISSIVVTILNSILIQKISLWGAVIASFVASFLNWLITYVMSKRAYYTGLYWRPTIGFTIVLAGLISFGFAIDKSLASHGTVLKTCLLVVGVGMIIFFQKSQLRVIVSKLRQQASL